MERKWMSGALILFFLVSILGLLMRYVVFAASPFLPFNHILHAHSHTALLGFGFLFLLGAFLFVVIEGRFNVRYFARLAGAYFIATLGMGISFLYQSYGAISITFSTIVMILAYVMVFAFLKTYRKHASDRQNPLIRWSLYWFIISSLGIWVLGPTAAILSKSHHLYFLSIQFFLHFQFNGFFTFAALGLILFAFGDYDTAGTASKSGLLLLNISLLLTYFLSVTFVHKDGLFFAFNSAGVALQFVAYILLLKPTIKSIRSPFSGPVWVKWILYAGIIFIITKVLVQGIVMIPSMAVLSYSIREFIIGYIHLILLGATTFTVAGILLKYNVIPRSKWTAIGWVGTLITFVITEIIIFGHGIATWQGVGNALSFIKMIFYATVPFPVFIGCIVYGSVAHYISQQGGNEKVIS